jgi:hypothetical protein
LKMSSVLRVQSSTGTSVSALLMPLGSVFALEHSEFGGQLGVKKMDTLALDELEEFLSVLFFQHELDLDGHISRQLEKMLFVQDAIVAVAGDGAECRTARYADFLRLLQQPFVQQNVMMFSVFVYVEFKINSLRHVSPSVACSLPSLP